MISVCWLKLVVNYESISKIVKNEYTLLNILILLNKIMKRLNRTLTVESNEENENQLSISGFDIVLNFQSDNSNKQYRTMLDSLKEKPNNNEMQVIKMFDAVKSQKNRVKQKDRNRAYTQYCDIMDYAHIKNQASKFKQRKLQLNYNAKQLNSRCKSNQRHHRNLTEIMQNKKAQYISIDNILYQQKIKVENMLANSKTRKDVLEKAILFQRLYHIQQTQKPQKKNSKLPQRFCGVDPKHLRVPQSNLDQKGYQRRKIVYGLRKFQFYHHANKLQRQFINKKRDANSSVINIILQTAKQQAYQNSKKFSNCQDSGKKLFLKYSNSDVQNPEQMYKSMTSQNLRQFLKDFSLQYQNISEVKDMLSANKQFSYFQFYQVLYLLAIHKSSHQQEYAAQFYVTKMISQLKLECPNHYYPPLWLKLKNNYGIISKATKVINLKQNVTHLFDKFLIKVGKNSQRCLMSFTDLLELLWQLQIYPKKIGKRLLRFYFLYTKSEEGGLTAQNLQELLVSISIEKADTNVQITNQIKQLSKLIKKHG